MRRRLAGLILWGACLWTGASVAGEILILQPTPEDGRSRNARESERAMDQARQHAGKPGAMTTIILDEAPDQKRDSDRSREAARESAQDARDYLRPVPGGEASLDGGTTIILRSAPVRESERLQQRARSYIAPAARKDCGSAGSQIGVIGEGPGATRGNVHERGTSSVDAQGQCR